MLQSSTKFNIDKLKDEQDVILENKAMENSKMDNTIDITNQNDSIKSKSNETNSATNSLQKFSQLASNFKFKSQPSKEGKDSSREKTKKTIVFPKDDDIIDMSKYIKKDDKPKKKNNSDKTDTEIAEVTEELEPEDEQERIFQEQKKIKDQIFLSKFIKDDINQEDLLKKLKQKESNKWTKSGHLTFQLVSDEDFAVEGDFEFKEKEIEILTKLGGKFNEEFKYWAFNMNQYHIIYDVLKKEMLARIINPITRYPIETVLKVPFNKLKIETENGKRKTIDYSTDTKKSIDDLPISFLKNLYEYQKEGIKFGINNKARCIIADEMGVGKTVQAIGISYIYRSEWPVLILCPSSLKYNWEDEILKWLKGKIKSEDVQVVNKGKEKLLKRAKYVIVSYDLSRSPKIKEEIKNRHFQFVIADETHFLKNPKADRTIVNLPIIRQSKRVLFLSGTPILSKPEECYNILSALRPDMFNNFVTYGARYCDAKKTEHGIDYSGSSNSKELNYILNKLMIRRLKKDVLSQLPKKSRIRVEIPIDASYQKELSDLLRNNDYYVKYMNDPEKQKLLKELDNEFENKDEAIDGEKESIESVEIVETKTSKKSKDKKKKNDTDLTKSEISNNNNDNNKDNNKEKKDDNIEDTETKSNLSKKKINRARDAEGKRVDPHYFIKAYSLTAKAKVDGVKSYIKKFIEISDEKCLVFAHHKTILNGVEQLLIDLKVDYIRIDGSVKSENRQDLVYKFQNIDKYRVAVLAITACATGLTLTRASTVIFAELYYTPAIMIQAEDRAHRIGQKNQVSIRYLYGLATIDEIFYPRIREKYFVVSSILDDQQNDHIHKDELFIVSKSGLKRSLSVSSSLNSTKSSLDNNQMLPSEKITFNKLLSLKDRSITNVSTRLFSDISDENLDISKNIDTTSTNNVDLNNTNTPGIFENLVFDTDLNTLGDINLHSENKKRNRDEFISKEDDKLENISPNVISFN